MTGPGGAGKTRLALEVAAEPALDFPDGVVFVELAAVSEPPLALTAIAHAVGVEESAGSLEAALERFLVRRATLLVLDNLEQVLGASPLVARLLAAAPRLKVLVTSRIPLRIRGEREFPLGGLSPRPRWRSSPSALRRSGRSSRPTAPSPSSAPRSTGFRSRSSSPRRASARSAAGAAARAPLRPARPARGRRPRPPGAPPHAPGRGRLELRAARAHRAGGARPARRLLGRLHARVRRRGLRRGRLRARDADRAQPAAPRGRPLPHARDDPRLRARAARGARRGSRRSSCGTRSTSPSSPSAPRWRCCAARSRRTGSRASRPSTTTCGRRSRWAHDAGQTELELRLAGALRGFWYVRSYLGEGRRWYAQALAERGQQPPALRAKALRGAHEPRPPPGPLRGRAALRRRGARALPRRSRTTEGVQTSLNNLAALAVSRGEPERARALFVESRELAAKRGDRWGEALTGSNLGYLALTLDDLDGGRAPSPGEPGAPARARRAARRRRSRSRTSASSRFGGATSRGRGALRGEPRAVRARSDGRRASTTRWRGSPPCSSARDGLRRRRRRSAAPSAFAARRACRSSRFERSVNERTVAAVRAALGDGSTQAARERGLSRLEGEGA